ncbi:MAG: MFS transporter [Desulfovibrionaceae bacterium]
MTSKPRLSNVAILNMSLGFFGIQFGWGLQMANMSSIYEILGASPDKIPILWLAAPLTGLLVQPIIGSMSDRTWTWLGRRRPFFLAGAVFATLALVFMPYSTALWMAAILLWIMDTSVNVSMEPFRAFVADMLPEEQRTKGFAMQSVLIGLGAVVATSLPFILTNVFGVSDGSGYGHDRIPDSVELAFHIGAAAYFLCVMWTIVTTKEYPPEDMAAFKRSKKEHKGFGAVIREIWTAFKEMPPTMRELAWVQVFSWMGLFCMFLYYGVAVAHHVFQAVNPNSAAYMEGIEWAGLCFAAYNAVCFVFSMFLAKLAEKFSRKGLYVFCLLAGAVGLIGTSFAPDKWVLMVLMVGVGMAWAGILALPYAILAGALPQEKMGVYMGIFNFFITIPEILISLGFGWAMLHVLQNNRMAGVVFGGVCMIIAAALVLRVKDVGEKKIERDGV